MYNLLGILAPALAALAIIPALLSRIGETRFGALSLVWLLLVHVGVFDLGLSRATANRIARLDAHDLESRRSVLWTSICLNALFGVLGAAILYIVVEPLAVHVFDVQADMRAEVLAAAPWLALAAPLVTIGGASAGALEGSRRFDVVNAIQAFGAVLIQAAPLAAAYLISPSFDVLVASVVLSRALATALLAAASVRIVAPGPMAAPQKRWARELFGYGAWIFVSALLLPAFMTLDKLLIGAMIGAVAVAYYSVSDQIVRRVAIMPASLVRSIFPRIAGSTEREGRELALKSSRAVVAVMTPILVALIVGLHPFLAIWIDPAFAQAASAPGVILAAGIWINSVAMTPSVYLQASGRPDVTAKCHLIEIGPHVVVLWLCIEAFGMLGAACAMLFTSALDASLLMRLAGLDLWRMRYFWEGAAWIAGVCALALLGDNSFTMLVLGAAFTLVCAVRMFSAAPEVAAMCGDLLRSLTAVRKGS